MPRFPSIIETPLRRHHSKPSGSGYPPVVWVGVIVGLILLSRASVGSEPESEPIRFNRDIRPILSDRCFACHGPDPHDRKAGLRLDVAEGAYAESEFGAVPVVPGDPEASEVVYRITSDDDFDRMPPPEAGDPLTDEEIALIRRWIEQGGEYETHWAYTEPTRPAVPEMAGPKEEPLGPIDAFIAQRLAEEGLQPAPPADPVTLVRRLYLDLTGLPPTPEQVDEFVADPSDAGYRELVDRLLESPRHAERLAQYWLDLVRYADTVGYHGDQEHHAAPYRDWVIDAFARNLPFDRFTEAQLAGDLLPGDDVDQKIASAYNRILQTTHEGGAQDKEYLAKYSADRVRNVSAVWMGVTLGCAECHDHKYDPFTQRDFYTMAAFFADIQEQGAFSAPNSSPTTRKPEIQVLSPLVRRRIEAIDDEIERLRREADDDTNAEDRSDNPASTTDVEAECSADPSIAGRIAELTAERDQLADAKQWVMVTERRVDPRPIRVLPRGDWLDESGPIVEPAVPGIFGTIEPRSEDANRADRLDLARWLTEPDNPLTARTFVNRAWYLMMGQGLTDSLQDVGSQGGWPTHPELLDWLAVEFMESGWDVRHILRTIVTSRTYRQGSMTDPETLRTDPTNRLFARQTRKRWPAETIRDSALAVSGLLVERMGGPSTRPYQPAGYYAHLNFPKRTYKPDEDWNQYRRGVYVHWQRQFLHPMLRAFDAPTREECTARRPVSNTPLAALVLMNDPTFVEASVAFAVRVLDEVPTNGETGDRDRIIQAFRIATARYPEEREVLALAELLTWARDHYAERPEAARELIATGLYEPPADLDPVEMAAWSQVTRAVLNLHETITRD